MTSHSEDPAENATLDPLPCRWCSGEIRTLLFDFGPH
jgi:hypothetical protein